MGLHSETKAKIENCLRENIRAGKIAKDSVLNPQDIHTVCRDFGIDPRTAESHMPGLVGLEIEGPDFRGRIVEFNPDSGPYVKIDPPVRDPENQSTASKSKDILTYAAMGVGLARIALVVLDAISAS